MEPTIGRIVHYSLTAKDAESVNKRRQDAKDKRRGEPEDGVQLHVGNTVRVGDIFPLLVTRIWSGTDVNGQVFLDGNDTLWVRSVSQATIDPITGETAVVSGAWFWPPKA